MNPLEKEIPFENHHFQVPAVGLPGGVAILVQLLPSPGVFTSGVALKGARPVRRLVEL